MKNKHVIINIIGTVGTGKTILAVKLQEFLNREGFKDVYINDVDDGSMDIPLQKFLNVKNSMWNSIKDRRIDIKTTQARIDFNENY